MICEPCKQQTHTKCVDFDEVKANKRNPEYVLKTDYKSCMCQHRAK